MINNKEILTLYLSTKPKKIHNLINFKYYYNKISNIFTAFGVCVVDNFVFSTNLLNFKSSFIFFWGH